MVGGGAEGDRTPDLMAASHALSQLSYSPSKNFALYSRWALLCQQKKWYGMKKIVMFNKVLTQPLI